MISGLTGLFLTSRSTQASCTILSIWSVVTPGFAARAAISSTSRANRHTFLIPSCSCLVKILSLLRPENPWRVYRQSCRYSSLPATTHLLALWDTIPCIVRQPYPIWDSPFWRKWVYWSETTSERVGWERVEVSICVW